MRALTIAEDGYVSNLTRVFTAVVLTEDVPSASAKRLRAAVRAVRLYAEAGERSLANRVLDQITDAAADLPDAVGAVVVKHAEGVRRHWNVDGGVK